MKHGVLLSAITLACVSSNAEISIEKIQMKEGVREAIKESHRLYRETNAKKIAEREIAATMVRSIAAFQGEESVSLPICDEERTPHGDWKFIATSEKEHVLKYVGGVGFGPQFIRWSESAWVRIAGSKQIYREGMYCGSDNYIAIDVDKSFSENTKFRKTPVQLVDGVILHLASKLTADEPRLMQGEVVIAATSSTPVRVAIELWSIAGTPKLLATNWEYVSHDPLSPKTLRVEATTEAKTQTLVVVRLDPALRERAAKGESDAKLYLFGASVYPKH